jgi:hypothetical protein
MFNKFKTQRSVDRLVEEQLYEQVVVELSEGKVRLGCVKTIFSTLFEQK